MSSLVSGGGRHLELGFLSFGFLLLLDLVISLLVLDSFRASCGTRGRLWVLAHVLGVRVAVERKYSIGVLVSTTIFPTRKSIGLLIHCCSDFLNLHSLWLPSFSVSSAFLRQLFPSFCSQKWCTWQLAVEN